MSLLECSPSRSLFHPITRASDTRGARSQRGDADRDVERPIGHGKS